MLIIKDTNSQINKSVRNNQKGIKINKDEEATNNSKIEFQKQINTSKAN